MIPLFRSRPFGLLLCASVVAGCGDSQLPLDEGPVELVPSCADPLPVEGTFDARAPGYIVLFKPGTDAVAATEVLAATYDFTPTHVFPTISGFAGLLAADAVAGIRCASNVKIIEHDGVVTVD